MAQTIHVERFVQNGESCSGELLPQQLKRLKPFLFVHQSGKDANEMPGKSEMYDQGEIRFSLFGETIAGSAGVRKQRIKCIIQGWLFLADPAKTEPVRHELSIKSVLVLARNENDLPPLEDEPADEDFVVLSGEQVVDELIEEEILLDLPFWAISSNAPKVKAKPKKTDKLTRNISEPVQHESPFEKLAQLRGTGKLH